MNIRDKFRAFTKKLLLLGFTLFIFFCLFELGFRLYPNSAWLSEFKQEDPYIGIKYQTNLDMDLAAEGGGFYRIKTNSLGFIGEEFRQEKNEETFRIVNLGDSFTSGVSVDYDKNYVHLLGLGLSQSLGREVESLNFGIEAQSTAQAALTYEHYARGFKPDLVILWFYLGNDFKDNVYYREIYERDKVEQNKTFIGQVKNVARKSNFLRFIVNRLGKNPGFAKLLSGRIVNRIGNDSTADADGVPIELRLLFTEDEENTLARDLTKEYLSKLQNLLKQDNIDLIVVIVPANFQVEPALTRELIEQYPSLRDKGFDELRPNRELAEILNELAISYFDLTPSFRERCQETCKLYVCPNCHLGVEGHTYVSEVMARELLGEYFNKEKTDEELLEENL